MSKFVFTRMTEQLLEDGLSQMREANEKLWSENHRLREENHAIKLALKEAQNHKWTHSEAVLST
jgi:hypothetical protein